MSHQLLLFALTAFAVIVIPGPSVLFVVGRALAHGPRVATLSVLGNAAGEYLQVVAVAIGLGSILQRSLAAYEVLKVAGGLYLIYLGVRTFRRRRAGVLPSRSAPGESRPPRHPLLEGFAVGASNPKTLIFLAAILPQFINRGAGDVPVQVLLLGLVFMIIAVVSDTAWALAAGRLRGWFERSRARLDLLGGVGGIAIAAVGVTLLVSGRKD